MLLPGTYKQAVADVSNPRNELEEIVGGTGLRQVIDVRLAQPQNA